MGDSTDKSSRKARKLSHVSLILCLLLFTTFAANVLLGKAKLIFEMPSVPIFSDITEYLLLMATALFFAIAALMKERATAQEDSRYRPDKQ